MRLTDLAIRKLPLSDTQKIYFDDVLGGFGIRCAKKTKSFVIKYGEERKFKTIGHFPEKSLADARKEAKLFLATRNSFTGYTTYPEARKAFLADCKKHNRASTVRGYNHYLGVYDTHKRVSNLTRFDILDHLKRYEDKPSGYSHALTAFKIFFNWCLRKEIIDRHPVAGEKSIAMPSRERVLLPEEIRAVWAYEHPHFSTILKLCLLTGQRRSEIAGIVPEWIKDDVLSLPPEITKNGRRHSIPLQLEALQLMVDVPFGQNGKSWNGWSNGMKRLWKYVDIPHFVIHDLRRTFSTIHAEIGTPIHITERLLNHASGTSTSGVVGIYNRYSYMDEMKHCQEKYRDCLIDIVT